MEIETAQSMTTAFQHGFSAGVAFALLFVGIIAYGRRRFDP